MTCRYGLPAIPARAGVDSRRRKGIEIAGKYLTFPAFPVCYCFSIGQVTLGCGGLRYVSFGESRVMKTFFAKESNITPQWLLVNAEGKVLGRIAVSIATVLMGKHRPSYTPNQNCGDFVVVVNAEKVRLTGKKLQQKSYSRWTGYPGGRRVTPIGKVFEQHPERVLREAVRRMLPKGLMGKRMLTRLKVYAGGDHPHAAQRPEPVELAMK